MALAAAFLLFLLLVIINTYCNASPVAAFDDATFTTINICSVCHCLEDSNALEPTVIVECFEISYGKQRGFDLGNILWPTANDANDKPPRVRAFFRDLPLPSLTKLPIGNTVEELSFERNSIKALVNTPFARLKNLHTLTITGNNLGALDKDFFTTENYLIHLDLSNNSLTNVAALERARFDKLQVLNISHNRLKVLSKELLVSIENVAVVHLKDCEIYTWDTSSIKARWKILDLGQNKLTTVTSSMFGNLDNLEVLDLSYNEISFVDILAFQSLRKLERLDISYNKVANLDANLILPQSLQMISAAGNSLQRWPFDKMPPNLRSLEMQDNQLLEIIVGDALNLEIVNLRNNRLDAFYGDFLSAIRSLDLAFNALLDVPRNLGKQLETLILDGNPMDRIFIEQSLSLKLLSLNQMPNLEHLGPYSFYNLDGKDDTRERDCVDLQISHCPQLTRIDPRAFNDTSLCKLDLSYNNLATIDSNLVKWEDLLEFNLQGNPWDCSCPQQWLVDDVLPILYEQDDLQYYLDNFRCASPAERKDNRLVKFLNHRDPFCGGAGRNGRMERLQMEPAKPMSVDGSQGIAQAGFLARWLCEVDEEENCLHAHEGIGLISLAVVLVVTMALSIVMIVYIINRKKRERRMTNESVWLIQRHYR